MAGDLKLGLNTGYWRAGPPPGVEEAIAEADRLGFDSVWTAEAYGSDVLTPLAWWGSKTKNVRLGTAIMQMSARQPAAAAMAAMTMDHLSGGRFILGLGVSGPQVVEGWYGMPFAKPLARTREYVKIVRDIVARKGPVTNDGPHYPLPVPERHRARQAAASRRSIRCARTSRSSSAPRARRTSRSRRRSATAGWRSSRRATQASTATRSRRGSRATGARRSWDDFEVAATVPVIIHDDVEQAADFLRPMYALYFGGMGARGANFHHDVAVRLGYEAEAKQIQDLYLDGKEGRGRRGGADAARRGAGADRPRGQDPRRPRAVARVDRHDAARRRRRRDAAPRSPSSCSASRTQ